MPIRVAYRIFKAYNIGWGVETSEKHDDEGVPFVVCPSGMIQM